MYVAGAPKLEGVCTVEAEAEDAPLEPGPAELRSSARKVRAGAVESLCFTAK